MSAPANKAAVRGPDAACQKLSSVHIREGGRLPAYDKEPSCSNFCALGEGNGVVDVDTQIADIRRVVSGVAWPRPCCLHSTADAHARRDRGLILP